MLAFPRKGLIFGGNVEIWSKCVGLGWSGLPKKVRLLLFRFEGLLLKDNKIYKRYILSIKHYFNITGQIYI